MLRNKVFSVMLVAALVLAGAFSATSTRAQTDPAPLVLQDFEGEVEFAESYQAEASVGDVAQTGKGSLKSASETGEWHAVSFKVAGAPVDISGFDQFCFGVNDTTEAKNTVGVRLYDSAGAKTERWTDNEGVGANPKTKKDTWTAMCLNLISFTGLDLTKIEKVEFTMFAAGVYYFDDVVAQMFSAAAAEPAKTVELTVVQDFETDGTFYADYQAEVSLGDVAKNGKTSLKAFGESGEWHAFGAYPAPRPLDATGFDALCFFINDTTANNDGKAANTVGVSIIDAAGVKDEVWTDHETAGVNPKTVKDEWVQMCINLDAYTKADLTQIDKIQFAMFWAGTYYVDDLALGKFGEAVAAPPAPAANLDLTVVQEFEAEDTFYADYQAELSLGDVARSGKTSLKVFGESGEWHAFGAYPATRPLDATGFSAVCFWIYDTTANNDGKAANTVGVSIIDAAGVKDEVWTDHELAGANPKTVKDEWVQMCINLEAYTKADLTQIDKIQFALYWAGTYYLDDIALGKAK